MTMWSYDHNGPVEVMILSSHNPKLWSVEAGSRHGLIPKDETDETHDHYSVLHGFLTRFGVFQVVRKVWPECPGVWRTSNAADDAYYESRVSIRALSTSAKNEANSSGE